MIDFSRKHGVPLALILLTIALATSGHCVIDHRHADNSGTSEFESQNSYEDTENEERLLEYLLRESTQKSFTHNAFKELREFGEFSSTNYQANSGERSTKGNARHTNRAEQKYEYAQQIEDNKTVRSKIVKKSRNELEQRETGSRMNRSTNESAADERIKRAALFHSLDRNSTDYYERRKAAMEKFFARQREINEKYGKKAILNPKPLLIDLNARTKDIFQSNLNQSFIKANESVTSTRNVLSEITSNPNSRYRDTSPLITALNAGKTGNNYEPMVENNTSVNFSTKQKKKSVTDYDTNDDFSEDNEEDDYYEDNTPSQPLPVNNNDVQRWGNCKGKVVYQHNLLLGLRGPSNLNAVFEVTIETSICVTCVETIRYNRTRAIVTLDSGGRGYNFVKLKLQGYENEGFSYIIKVWGVKKIHEDCNDVL